MYLMNPHTSSIAPASDWAAEGYTPDNAELLPVELADVPDPVRLEAHGWALYGRSWKTAMAEDLGVDARRITHWVQGTRPVPAGVWLDLQKIAQKRLADVQEAAAGLL